MNRISVFVFIPKNRNIFVYLRLLPIEQRLFNEIDNTYEDEIMSIKEFQTRGY